MVVRLRAVYSILKWLKQLLVIAVLTALTIVIILMEKGILHLDPIPYTFPIRPGSPEWAQFSSKRQKITVSQIPERKLKNMTTKALLETVIDYPLIMSFYAFNNIESACDTMAGDFNGFGELVSRSDINKVLLNRYKNTRVITAEEVKNYDELEEPTEEQSFEFFTVFGEANIVEFLFEFNKIINGAMPAEDFAVLSELAAQKNAERRAVGADIYSENSMYYP